MAENLNYATKGSVCHDNKPANCDTYGRLYDWHTAIGDWSRDKDVCPDGWHLPDTADWNMLVDYVGGDSIAGKKLKSKTDWREDSNGTDEYGFSALPGQNSGSYGHWWSSTEETGKGVAWFGAIYYNKGENVNRFYIHILGKNHMHSVRCVQDDVKGGGNEK